jgi:peroxiredoxin Q/BCP
MANAEKLAIPMLQVGDHAPDFTAPIDGGGSVTFSDYAKADKKVVLYFYPKDDTPGCTIEAKDFRDNITAFEAAGTVVLGVSKDTVAKHDKFKTKYCLPFSLVSDEDGSICEAYSTWVEKSMYGKKYMGIERATYLIDASGYVAQVWRKVSVTGHVSEVLSAAKTL